MAGRGRAPKARGIASVRELTQADVARLESGERGKLPVVARFRDSHHKVARLVASGARLQDVAIACGYSMVRVYTLNQDPSFKELVEHYRSDENEAYKDARDDYYELIYNNTIKAERILADKLDENGEELSVRELHLISRDGADRIGYGKRSTSVTINQDFAAQLEQAIQRSSKVIEGTVVAEPKPAPQRVASEVTIVPSRILRRA